MRKISLVEQKTPRLKPQKKVAAYARVSKDTERLMHSASAQVSYYSDLIQKKPDWQYAGVYVDYGITGTSVSGRDEFKRMLADCEDRKIDIILTKSISRFARNTVDLLETVRHLKDIGVEVRFEEQNISTMSGNGELMLTILASYAQEESYSISENSKWGIRKRFQSGEIGAANKHILGYRYDDALNQYIIIPEEAVIVRRMFQMYIDRMPLRDICDVLNREGYRTVNGCKFQKASMSMMIKNEIYAGDLRRQKCYIVDPISKRKIKNGGELPQYYISNAHEAILDREIYARVREEIKRREALLNPTYCFTKKITCAMCGNAFTRKKSIVKGKEYVHWICRSKKETGMTCSSPNFADYKLRIISALMMGTDEFDEAAFLEQVLEIHVLESGSLEFVFSDGRTATWERM